MQTATAEQQKVQAEYQRVQEIRALRAEVLAARIEMERAVHCVADCIIRHVIPRPTEWQRIGDQINAALIFARADFVNVRWTLRWHLAAIQGLNPVVKAILPRSWALKGNIGICVINPS